MGILIGSLIGFPENSWAACLNSYQTQTIAAAYNGDTEPTVHTIEACGGDDVSYQIPIATTINFDGVQYDAVYATTNSVITFGRADNTYWDYPQTPSISLYSMDWVIYPSTSGWGRPDESMIISYSEGGFQVDMNLRPIWMQSQPEPVNIVINAAITNSGGLAISYSTAFPATGVSENYPGLRTGVRLHNGQVVSLESAGFYEVQNPESLQLSAEPVDEETYVPGQPVNPSTPEEPILTPEEQQEQVAEAAQLANEISDLNNLIAGINGEEPIEEVVPDLEPSEEPTEDSNIPEPDVEVEPEIIDSDDPRFPNDLEPSQDSESLPSEDESSSLQEPNQEPDQDQDQTETTLPDETNGSTPSENNLVDNDTIDSTDGISEEELKKLNKLISANDAKLLSELVKNDENIRQAVEEFLDRSEKNINAPMPYTIADAITEVQAEKLLEDPIGAISSIFTEIDLEKITDPSQWGKDMTDDQREKAQEVIIPVILVSNIVSSVMSLRRL